MLAPGKMYFTVWKKGFQNGSYCTTQCKIKGHQGSSKGDWIVCEEMRGMGKGMDEDGWGWMRMGEDG